MPERPGAQKFDQSPHPPTYFLKPEWLCDQAGSWALLCPSGVIRFNSGRRREENRAQGIEWRREWDCKQNSLPVIHSAIWKLRVVKGLARASIGENLE